MKRIALSLMTLLTSFSTLSADLLDIAGQPTIGDPAAKVQVVALLEPKCPDSKRYNNDSFPKLKAEYIDSKKITYTVITTSFLTQSMPAADALLCVYNQDSAKPRTDLFFKYLNYIYQVQPPERKNWATTETLLDFAAKASPEINQAQLKTCLETGHHEDMIVKNTTYGNDLMGHLHTPTIFVDGIKIENKDDTIDYEKLKTAIDQALKNKK